MSLDADDVLARAIDRHGGLEAYRAIDAIHLGLVSFGGPLMRLKGLGVTFRKADRVVVRPHDGVVAFDVAGEELTYERGAVTSAVGRSDRHRRTFVGLGKLRLWSQVDACYFLGYALLDYLRQPFLLRDVEIVGHDASADGGAWVEARFPDDADTHCGIQRFHFDRTGLLVRHDYTADILGRVFTGAHFSADYDETHALPVARGRRVLARLGTVVTPLIALAARLEVEAVERRTPPLPGFPP